jgi:hypothetical protein
METLTVTNESLDKLIALFNHEKLNGTFDEKNQLLVTIDAWKIIERPVDQSKLIQMIRLFSASSIGTVSVEGYTLLDVAIIEEFYDVALEIMTYCGDEIGWTLDWSGGSPLNFIVGKRNPEFLKSTLEYLHNNNLLDVHLNQLANCDESIYDMCLSETVYMPKDSHRSSRKANEEDVLKCMKLLVSYTYKTQTPQLLALSSQTCWGDRVDDFLIDAHERIRSFYNDIEKLCK